MSLPNDVTRDGQKFLIQDGSKDPGRDGTHVRRFEPDREAEKVTTATGKCPCPRGRGLPENGLQITLTRRGKLGFE
jgi:hypothetical protein